MALIRSPAVIFSVVIVCVVVSVFFGSSQAYGLRGFVGGRTEICDVKTNKEVQELGRFSVDEYNRRSVIRHRDNGAAGGDLRFVEVVKAQRQVVSGIKYYLKVSVTAASATEAETGQERGTFDSVVVVKPWLQSKQLLEFSPSNDRDVHS